MAFVEQAPALTESNRRLTAIPSPAGHPARRSASTAFAAVAPEAAAATTRAAIPAIAAREAMSVYVIADEGEERDALLQGLAGEGFRVSGFEDAAGFYRAFIAARCDMAVIDLMLRGESALSIAENLRGHAGTGIVVLSPVASIEARLRSFEHGADAYLVKPVDLRELSAQVRAINRRIASARAGAPHPEPAGNWSLAEGGWILSDPIGNQLHLTTSERALLMCLIRMRGQPVSRDEIISSLGGNPRYADPHRIDVLVNRLRQKASSVNMTLPLHSVRCKGYALAAETTSVPF